MREFGARIRRLPVDTRDCLAFFSRLPVGAGTTLSDFRVSAAAWPLAGGIIVLIPGSPLVFLMVLSSFINGLLLPFVLIFALALVNNRKLMGEYVNNRFFNVVAWLTITILTVLAIALVIMMILKLNG